MLNVGTEGAYDLWWNDVYHYVLYTRGGPHWQTTRVNRNDSVMIPPALLTVSIFQIPFSKFFLASKGRIQDRQGAIPLNKVSNFGVTVTAKGSHDGAFQLEIDYIGLEFDPANTERFAYEMYNMPKYTIAT